MDIFATGAADLYFAGAELTYFDIAQSADSTISIKPTALKPLPDLNFHITDIKVNALAGNVARLYDNALTNAAGEDLGTWGAAGDSLLEALAGILSQYHGETRYRLSGEILTETAFFSLVIDPDRKFEVLELTADLVTDTININIGEVL